MGGEVLTLTVISSFLSGGLGGFTSGGGRGGVGIFASVLLGANFELCEGRGGRLSSLVM
jgi:hypothetical protein